MDVSVIIPTLKPPSEIEAVEYLERGTFDDYEVVVSDAYPVTRARNEGIERASADKLVFLDDDSRPRENYLEQASKTLEEQYAVAGRIFHPRDDIFRKYFTAHYSHGDYPKTVDRFWGCNMALRREAVEAVGGWDEQMGWGHEEKELAERVTEEFDIYYEPDMVVDHPYAESIPDYWRKHYELAQQTPYYWETQGMSASEQVKETVSSLVNPLNYLGRTPTATVTRAGGTLAQGVGRIQGLLANRSRNVSTARPADCHEPVGGNR
ncbi:Glycosyltransferase, GT2 family [Halopelagius inordinatus]|uniref:Glycosyltransferase, GT2 family n=1 Tax=Halopelagius inordinatus TaxID=553467 RepID=A0A1I2PDS2_9EURY|nr:galactosyltransferase-related protein [Halopelagius inordinatus]SFG14224.1 Glycosyltransferase, GT2 family [Halopelagius inordinatus]